MSLAQRGVSSIFTYKASEAAARRVVAEAIDLGAKAFALKLDTGNLGSFDAFVGRARAALASWEAHRVYYLLKDVKPCQQ